MTVIVNAACVDPLELIRVVVDAVVVLDEAGLKIGDNLGLVAYQSFECVKSIGRGIESLEPVCMFLRSCRCGSKARASL